jgi:hypothetical protein
VRRIMLPNIDLGVIAMPPIVSGVERGREGECSWRNVWDGDGSQNGARKSWDRDGSGRLQSQRPMYQ